MFLPPVEDGTYPTSTWQITTLGEGADFDWGKLEEWVVGELGCKAGILMRRCESLYSLL